ncbi:hypothetical protein A0H81_07545 [Grifola frondosa]|uniref:DUF4604 domain-containing protein n=1 Tax=Grifola frondosa TaxID=5627 RepID=A0A1C7M7M8_GRIFR|nr:hypothetical protein A0H81_07545 [Grifola frondosa]
MSREPTRHQLSSRLSYNANTPAFLLRLQQRVSGGGGDDDDELEYDGSGRPPIPRRPSIPERPDDEPGSADEDDADEKPQVVVLKEGKHLSEREAENERRKGAPTLSSKGLPPLPEPKAEQASSAKDEKEPVKSGTQMSGLSFSSSAGSKAKAGKRKAVGDGRDDEKAGEKAKGSKKKSKKAEKKLLSFGDEA